MKEYLLIYRIDYSFIPGGTAEEAQALTNRWMDWMKSIDEKGRLSNRGNRLADTGRVLRASSVTDGPYAEIKESIGGYSIVKADNYDEAIELAKGCPVLGRGGNVEVREISIL